jgi:flagella basal body P-ring formation protein FlgA
MNVFVLVTLLSVSTVPQQVELVVTDIVEQSLPSQSSIGSLKMTYRGAKPSANTQLHASLAAPLKDNKARVRIEHVDSGGVVRSVGWVSVSAQICGPVLMATSDLAPGAVLSSADMHTETHCDVDPESILLAQRTWIGGKTKRSIHAQRVVRDGDIEPKLAIERGDWVALVFSRGSLRVRASAEALDRGAIGASVRVRRRGQRQALVGRVLGDGIVEVSP